MKGMKKLLSILMVLTLVLSLGANAFASTITMSDADANSTFTAYKLLKATYDEGTGLYQYTLNETFAAAIKAGLDAVDPENGLTVDVANQTKVVEAISALTGDDVRTFADAAFEAIAGSEAMKAAGEAADGTVFNNMEGYYLIAETVSGENENEVTSLVMLGTYGDKNETVTTKEEHPSSEKKVWEKNDTTGDEPGWQDAADWDIGDHVPFQLTGTLPGDYETYDSYKIVFHDKEEAGLSFDGESTVTVTCGTASYTLPHDGIIVTSPASDEHSFDIEITDVTKTFPDAENGSKIVVEYTSTLTEDAVIGQPGNPNEMYMEYTNDHYSDGTGETPEDKVVVFTFKIVADKVDGKDEALEGAGFTLLKKLPNDPAPEEYTDVTWETLGAQEKGTIVKYGDNYYEVDVAQITGETTFEFEGEDSGDYLLVETTVPTGYNRADDIELNVSATYDTNSQNPQLTGLTVTPDKAKFTCTLETGTISGKIVNLTGATLPETGGIGTTIFYIAGAILVAGAVIILVTKKRVSGAEK